MKHRAFARIFIATLASLAPQLSQASKLLCHINYGGETQRIESRPVASPYEVGTHPVGSFFLFRTVYQTTPAELANIKIYTYADRDGGPVIIHQASYPPDVSNAPMYGFTGLNLVYEPLRDGELQYWCEIKAGDNVK
jgi:hypothetical protein